MDKLDKILRYTKLYNIYMSQLSKTQQEILRDYYFIDLSISEIAQNRNSSRAAVEDALSKGNARLEELESELKILDKSEKILGKLKALQTRALNSTEIEELEEIEKELDYGI